MGRHKPSRLDQRERGWAVSDALAVAAVVCQLACSSAGAPSFTRVATDAGVWTGIVVGPANPRCVSDAGLSVQVTDLASCSAGSTSSAGTSSDYGDTLFGSEGYDDDCKYHASWTSSPIAQNQNVTFTLSATKLGDGSPVTGAVPYQVFAEAFLSEIHPAPPLKQTATEAEPGTYTIAPVLFDATGRWTVRFHLFEDCDDGPADSPHGHVAFFIDVR